MNLAKTVAVVNHYNIQPVYDIYVNVQGRDLGGVAADINKILNRYEKHLPRGTFVDVGVRLKVCSLRFQVLDLVDFGYYSGISFDGCEFSILD